MSSCCSIGHTSPIHGGARFGARAAHHHKVETNHQEHFILGHAPPPIASQIPLRFPSRRRTSKNVILPSTYAPLSLNSSHHFESDFIAGQNRVVPTDVLSKPQRSSKEGRRVSCKLSPELAALVNTTMPGRKGSPDVAAFVARPKSPLRRVLPVVIMIHEFYGLTEDIVGKAKALSEELGALVIAPDTYRGDWTTFIPKAIFLALSTPQDRVNEDLDSVVAWAAQQPDADVTRLAVMGFCYGGGKAIRYSIYNGSVAATVVFYGSPVTDVEALSSLKGPVLLIYGDKDAQFPPAKVNAFRDALLKAGVDARQTIYSGQGHAFFRNMAQVKAGAGPQRQAWKELVDFLRETLRSDGK